MAANAPHAAGRGSRRNQRGELPHNHDAEQSIIGGVVLQPQVLEQLDALEVDDFYDHRHKAIWSAIRNLAEERQPLDTVTLGAELERRERLDAVGGYAYLGECVGRVPTPENTLEYAKLVRRASLSRRVAVAADDIVAKARTWSDDPIELVDLARHTFEQISKHHAEAEKPLKVINAYQALDEIQSLSTAPVYETPFPVLNSALGFGGMLGTQVYTLAAGTGRGKTSFVGGVAAHQSQRTEVIVASYEMKPGYFVARHTAGRLGVHSNDIIRGKVPLKQIAAALPSARLKFMHKQPLADVRRAALRSKIQHGVAPLIIIDYLQKLAELIMATQIRLDARLATTEASAMLCDIAEETGSAILTVSATSRASSRRTLNPRKLEPYELVDVAKESGAVEYDGAGLIVLSLSNEREGDERIATVTMAKARFGIEMHIDYRFHGARGDFREIGEVVDTGGDEAPADLREKIIATLATHGSAKHQSALCKLVGGTKQIVNREIGKMLDDGSLVLTSRGIELGRSQ
jgi:replicative DNA helicase